MEQEQEASADQAETTAVAESGRDDATASADAVDPVGVNAADAEPMAGDSDAAAAAEWARASAHDRVASG